MRSSMRCARMPPGSASGSIVLLPRTPIPMASTDPSVPAVLPSPRRARGRGLLWLVVLALLGFAGWKLYPWWQAHMQPAAAPVAAGDTALGDTGAAILALRREQHDLAQRMSDTTSS